MDASLVTDHSKRSSNVKELIFQEIRGCLNMGRNKHEGEVLERNKKGLCETWRHDCPGIF